MSVSGEITEKKVEKSVDQGKGVNRQEDRFLQRKELRRRRDLQFPKRSPESPTRNSLERGEGMRNWG